MFIKIDKLLGQRLKKLRASEQIIASQIFIEFNRIIKEILGNKGQKRVKPLYVKNRKLTISVVSSVVSAEIKLHETEIIKKINKKIKKKIIDGLRFVT